MLQFVATPRCMGHLVKVCNIQGCSLSLERLGLEAVSRRFLERLGLVSVLKVERLGLESLEKLNVSVLRGLETFFGKSRSRLGLEG